jgi:hypothetical protein
MKTLNHSLIALFATIIISANTGCGSDPPVSTAGDEGGGGSGSDGGTGGMPGEGQCYDGNGNNCNNGSGGNGNTNTGKNWTTYSFDVFQNDPYETWGFIDSQAQDFLSCYMSTSCKKKMDSNDPSTDFQRLGDGNYEENYSGNMGCFVVARNGTNGDCGYNLQLQSGTEGLLWGKVYLSAGNDGQQLKTQKALVGFESGDKCAPAAVVVCSENAFTLKQFAAGTKP